SILEQMGSALATEGNLNNHIGVPLTLFRLAPEHQYGAIELGASGLGEIAHTVAIVQPRVAILTNAGQAHLEGFGSYQNFVLVKGELIDGLAAGGVAVLNRAHGAMEQWRERAGGHRAMTVSRVANPEEVYRATVIAGPEHSLAMEVGGPDGWR